MRNALVMMFELVAAFALCLPQALLLADCLGCRLERFLGR